jgi:hypothetical protein
MPSNRTTQIDINAEKFRQFLGSEDTQVHEFVKKMLRDAPMPHETDRFLLENAYERMHGRLSADRIRALDSVDKSWYARSLDTMLQAVKAVFLHQR